MKKLILNIKFKAIEILNKRISKLVFNRIILLLCIPIILIDTFLALVIMLKNWTLRKTRELNEL